MTSLAANVSKKDIGDFAVNVCPSTPLADKQIGQDGIIHDHWTFGGIENRTDFVAKAALLDQNVDSRRDLCKSLTPQQPVCSVVIPAHAVAGPSSSPLLSIKKQAREISLRLRSCTTIAEKIAFVTSDQAYFETLEQHAALKEFLVSATPDQRYVIGLIIALHQGKTVFDGLESLPDPKAALDTLAFTLLGFEAFYQPIGGVLGYHTTVIDLMSQSEVPKGTDHQYRPPPLVDLRTPNQEQWRASYEGISQLGKTAMILTLGGAGDRLNLIDETSGEPLPVARLQFCGKSLLEGLMRDIEALEYWHYRAFGNQVTSPILIMTSLEKQNDQHIEAMGRKANWFGHPQRAIRRMIQPSVPVIATDGQWVVTKPLQLALKPGGHGMVWKVAKDSGSLDWLMELGIDNAIVRQIHNPLAGLDQNLALLSGYGQYKNKAFGFLSSPSCPGLSEGMNVLDIHAEGTDTFGTISNVEYTQFGSLKVTNSELFCQTPCPVNANILFIALRAIGESLAKNPIPGMIVNAKTGVDVLQDGQVIKKIGARLESCMQNIADGLTSKIDPARASNPSPDDLSTFLLLQERTKMKSEIKSAFQPGHSPLATPTCGLYDWNKAMRQLFGICQVTLPHEQSIEEFLRDGPSILLAIHPAMGPFWDVIGQKVSGGAFSDGSEVELDIAELSCKELAVNGSFRLIANVATGPMNGTEGRSFTDKVGRAKLSHLIVRNKGLGSKDIGKILHGTIDRVESCEIKLEGFSEVVAENVTIQGDFHLVVPDGQRAVVTQGPEGTVVTKFEAITKPSWSYAIGWHSGAAPVLTIQAVS